MCGIYRSGSISKNELRTILKLLDAPTDKGTIYHAAKKMKMKKGRISKSNFTRSFSLFTMGGRIEYSEDSIRANGLARVHKDKAEDKGNHNATGDNDGIGNDGDTEHGGGNGDGGQAYGDVKGKYTSIHRSDAPLILSVLDFDLALEIHLSTRLVQMREERHQKKRARSTIKAHANADTVTHLPFNRNSTMTRVGVTTAATDSDINNNSNKNKNKTYSTGSSSSSNSNTNTSDSGKSNRKNDSTSAAQVPRTSLSVNALERYDTLTLYNIDPDMISESESEEEEGQGRAHASFSKTHPLFSLPPVELLKERDRVVAKAILTPLGILYSAMIKGRVRMCECLLGGLVVNVRAYTRGRERICVYV